MAYTDIDKPSDYFNTKLYTGTGGTQAITGVGFQPDWVWLKARSSAYSHQLFDVVRGATKLLSSEETSAEQTLSGVTAFGSDGFTVGSDAGSNNNTTTFASWNWKAGTSFTNDASATGIGTIDSTGSVNTDAGFSIISYTGNATTNAKVAHGLGVAPSMMIVKKRNGAFNWGIYHKSLTAHKLLAFTTGAPDDDASYWNDVEPTSSVFNLGSGALTNGSGSTMIAYCFAEKQGYSKFGSYTGNGNADGTFVYTGFKPAFVMVKQTNTARYWAMFDNKRDGLNPTNRPLFPNASDQESDSVNYYHDILSNGFKWRTNSNIMNVSGGTYIYMAFAENPFTTSTGVPATAR